MRGQRLYTATMGECGDQVCGCKRKSPVYTGTMGTTLSKRMEMIFKAQLYEGSLLGHD